MENEESKQREVEKSRNLEIENHPVLTDTPPQEGDTGLLRVASGIPRNDEEGDGNDGEERSRRRRRTRQKRKHRRHKHRPFSIESDRRKYHWKVIFIVIPSVLLVTGVIALFVGARATDELQRLPKMIKLGKLFIISGGSVLILLYLWSLWKKIKKLVHEWRHPARDTNLNWEHNHRRRRSKRRRHRSDYRKSASGFKAE